MVGANPVLVAKNVNGALGGISVDLAQFIASRLEAEVVPVVYADPEAYSQSFGKGEWDIAIGPHRAADAAKVDYSPDFMLVDNVYVARPGENFANAADVDHPGIKIAVAQGGAPDKYLTTALKSAELVRVPGRIEDATEVLRSGRADVYGSNGEFTYAVAERLAGATIVPGAFTTVPMTVMLPKGHSMDAQQELSRAVKAAIAAGLPRQAIDRQQLKGVRTVN
jgi:polar amino acid transport system substrate-binding protein